MNRSPSLILYKKCLGYAFKLDPIVYRDIVHDAFVTWFEKTGKSLFDGIEQTAIAVVKNKWREMLNHNRITVGGRHGGGNSTQHRRGKRLVKQFVSLKDVYLYNPVTPEDQYIAQELHEMFLSMDGQLRLDIYKYAIMGYKQKEIATLVGVSRPLINYYFKKMRYMASIWN